MLQSYIPLLDIMETLGKKWAVPIILALFIYDNVNFSYLKRHLNVTSRALSKCLKALEATGIVEKCILPTEKICYTLSGKGKSVAHSLVGFNSAVSRDS